MEYEIDFLPVGEGASSGDAICLRYSNDNGTSWHVGVIDGGTQSSGVTLCQHIRNYYNTNTIDFMICTHPDQDHASGLSNILDELVVKKIIMHRPWDYIDYFFDKVNDGRVTKESLRQRLIEKHPYAYKVYEKAIAQKIPIHDAFSDLNDHGVPNLSIASPSFPFYLNQVINFRSITSITEDTLEENDLFKSLAATTRKLFNWISESWDEEILVDPLDDATSSENNSSVVSFFNFDSKKILFTADAGTPALSEAADKIEELGHELQNFSFIQVPHHGSKRNIGPSILNRLVGPPRDINSLSACHAFISAAKEGEPKHPNKRVTNAFNRRVAKVVKTQGATISHFTSGTPSRGWGPAEPIPFYKEIEDDD